MTAPIDRVPKAQRLKLHRLKNAYRKIYRHEPELERPVTEEAATEAITFLEEAIRPGAVSAHDGGANRSAGREKRRRRR